MWMQRQCCKCQGLYTPVQGASAAFCAACSTAMQTAYNDGVRHRNAILAGSPNELPENDREHREVRQAIRRHLNPQSKDTNLSTWRDKK